MKIDRREFLSALEACAPGLASKENIEQSQCFVMQDNKIMAFNDVILTVHDTPLAVRGAVPAKPLLELLRKLTEDELEITATDSELRVKGEGRRSAIKLNPDIYLPTGVVDPVDHWTDLPPAFADSLPMVADCALATGDPLALTCVQILPNAIQACDQLQAARYEVETGVSAPVLLTAQACKSVNGLGVAAMCETESWIHWKTYTGLQVALRKIQMDYPEGIEAIFQATAEREINIPASVTDILTRAAPFLEETSDGKTGKIEFKPGRLLLTAKNGSGWYQEFKEIDYDGPALELSINPKYVANLLKHGLPAILCSDSLRIEGDGFVYCVSIKRG